MRNASLTFRTTQITRIGLIIPIALFLAGFIAPRALMQEATQQPAVTAERVTAELSRATTKEDANASKGEEAAADSTSFPFAPDLITPSTYVFTNAGAVALEDMSSGTTQLIAASQDDTASIVTSIGFEFWFDGVRQTQFSVNANGLFGLGSVAVNNGASGRTNDFATTTNNPKMSSYWDDMCTAASGKVHYKVVGSAPNRKLVVEWLNMTQFDNGLLACSPTIRGTYQLWLFESTGIIQMVNGGTTANDNGNGGYSVGIGSSSTSFASVTTAGPTVSYAASSNANVGAIAAGTQYTFTPNVPAAPTGLSFTAVTPTSMTLNWTDNASNEVGYAIYQSTDGINYSFVIQTAANATSQNFTGLSPTTNYFWQVYAVSEGALSSALSGSQSTTAPTSVSSTAAGGPWSSTATWAGGVVPTAGDAVTIVDGATVTIDTAAVAFSVTVGQGTSGILTWDTTVARTLTVGFDVTVASGGTFNTGAAGAITGHVLSLGGNLTNNGTLDFSTNTNTAGAGITFTGAANNTFGGTGATTDIRTLTINKGTSNANILELNPTNFTVQGVNTDVAGFLTLTNGTLKVSGTFTVTNRVFTVAAYTIGATGGFWLNNPNFTVAGQNGSPTESGLLRISQGTFNIGTATGNSMGFSTGSNITVEGGAVNATGRFGVAAAGNAISYNQTGGTITVCTIGNASGTLGSFDLGTSLTSSISINGGTIVLQLASTGATQIDYRDQAGSGTLGVTGGTLQAGNAASGAAKSFILRGVLPNLVISNTSANHSATMSTTLVNYNNISRNITINSGTTFNAGNVVFLFNGTTLTNNGTLTHNGASSNFVLFLTTGPVTYTGSGTVTAPMSNLGIQSDSGFIIDPAVTNIPVLAVRLFTGSITNANKLTIGNGGATRGTVQIGNTTTPTAAGTFDVAPTFNLGTGGQVVSYLRTTGSRTTGPEINPTRLLWGVTYDDNDATHTLTVAGGDLSMNSTDVSNGATTAVALTMTNGRVITGANNLILTVGGGVVLRTNGYVDGNLRKTYAAAVSKTFEVGTANGFSPVTVNATAGTFPSDFTVKATQGPQPSVNPATSIQRYWTLTEGGDITADLTFQYLDPPDVMGNEANYKVIRVIGGTPVAFPTSTVNGGTNLATLTGVSVFSDWTVGEIAAPTAAPATISGQVTTASGAPLAGVVMNLSGARAARTITDAQGNYRFSNIDTDNFYTVMPSIVNYHFSPASRSFSLLANKTDATFTGTLDAVVTGNVIDTPEFFVRQHYLDFLGREPDDSGLNFWSDQILSCGNDVNCLERRTINVSAAYFLSIEFRETGGLVDSLYHASYGRAPVFNEFMPDTATVARNVIVNQAGWQEQLRTNKQQFLDAWVQRAAFRAAYDNLGNDSYVDTLIGNTGVEFTAAERGVLVSGLNSNTLTRAEVLQQVAQNERFVKARFNEAFVRMQYFGYLRRDPDDSGFHFWLNKLNEFDGNFERAEMVKAFLVSGEYRDRFRQ
jgi:phage gpG-like protein